ncbi:hypothetical protein IRP63_15995 (plasmid) [Clostridium botulinum]|uniref:Nal1 N-terminal domain-containing protein n=1 Tax=Clostridium botulinum C/D str. DC5 TaxID=1443128 RepID=A0A0A0HZV7_CLOBO|nr:hypothetical protein [Clostridium botulinum]KGM92905.1 hypothetical protein Z955_16510 [Clostridium botulinum C/D str. DC5]KOC52064.1 hypothetical protein ADU89_12470 [Clostridium botulinum]KOC54638.1 hypothetical protein ADU90_12340 [Clostridium botulinum]MCD3235399.1 hypothetical protein [Clostridium botulinum D/C]MCD3241323.1 hypothetical protein [Clostridium botulinum D/C]
MINCSCSLEEKIKYICKCEYKYFLSKDNVVGIGLGYKIKNGFNTLQKCIKVFVINKVKSDRLTPNEMIPNNYKGIPTDVVESGVFTASSLKKKIRPVIGGYGVSASGSKTAGTVGCLVTNGVSNFILSTNHVLAGINKYPIGTPIIQPAYKDGGRSSKDTIATLYKFVPLRPITGTSQPINLSDAAIGLLTSPDILSNEIAFIGKPTCVKNPKLNEHVQKVGRTTELTKGIVTSTNVTTRVVYTSGEICLFHDLIAASLIGDLGDSGALVVNNSKCALGLILGKSLNNSLFCRLTTVMDQLGVHLVT